MLKTIWLPEIVQLFDYGLLYHVLSWVKFIQLLQRTNTIFGDNTILFRRTKMDQMQIKLKLMSFDQLVDKRENICYDDEQIWWNKSKWNYETIWSNKLLLFLTRVKLFSFNNVNYKTIQNNMYLLVCLFACFSFL